MKLETFFEKFELFAEVPGAVVKLRKLIMLSAFSGTFSAEKRDQPMPAEWAIEGAPTLPAIPSSWKWQQGREVFDVIRGVSYKKNDARDTQMEGYFPILRANNIGGEINFENLVYVPSENIREDQLIRFGDILIAMSSGSKKLVGKAAPITANFTGSFGAFCSAIRNKKTIPDEVLARYFQSPQYTSWVTAAGRGIGINNLGKGDLDSLPVPIPPIAEQKLIMAKVDELMALCDRLEAQQQEREAQRSKLARASLARFTEAPTPANLASLFHHSYDIKPSDLRKSILTLAVLGKLVPQSPDDEPAEKLLSTIAKQREKLVSSDSLRRTKSCRQFTSHEAPNKIPATWAWAMLGEITDIGTGSTPLRTETSFWIDGTIPWIASGSTSRSPISEGDELVTLAAVKAHRLRIYPPGTLLVALYGQGKTRGQVATLEIPATINQACAAVCPLNGIPPMQGYLKLLLEKQYDEMRSFSAGGAQPNLNIQKIKELFVPLPPAAEQCRIVAKVNQLMALVSKLETQLAVSRTSAASLLSAIFAEITTQ